MKAGILTASMTAIGYIRCSSEKQEKEGYSLIQQAKEIEHYCGTNGIFLTAIFREVKSAKSIEDREIFQEALKHLEANKADAMVFTNWDRFARDIESHERTRKRMTSIGKQLIATQQRFLTLVDEDDFELTAALQHVGVDNELERKKIRRRLVRGRQEKVEQGGWKGHRPPYEYDIIQGEPVLNVGRWQIVRKIVRLRRWTSLSYQGIAEVLNAQNVEGYSARVTVKKKVVKNSKQREDGKMTDSLCRQIIRDWYSGKRQQWRDFYETKRLERKDGSFRQPPKSEAKAKLEESFDQMHLWLSQQSKRSGKSMQDILRAFQAEVDLDAP